MRIVVTGATGNVGTAVLRALDAEPEVTEVVGVARRLPEPGAPLPAKVRWERADVAASPLEPVLAGADAVIHLAWLIQPSRLPGLLTRANVAGTRRLLAAATAAGTGTVVHASSVGAYSPGPKDQAVDESWPTGGVSTSAYSREKAAVEALLDDFEQEHPEVRVVRLRPGLIFQRAAAEEIARLFLGPLVPTRLVRPGRVPVVPDVGGLRFQAVHADDVASAYRAAVCSPDARGAYNIAAGPPLDAAVLAEALGARRVPLPAPLVRQAAAWSYRLHLQPTAVGWVDLALQVPVMSTARAERELGWSPQVSATDALRELLAGFGERASGPTPPLAAGRRAGASASPEPGAPGR